jgi:hypothetical protein
MTLRVADVSYGRVINEQELYLLCLMTLRVADVSYGRVINEQESMC